MAQGNERVWREWRALDDEEPSPVKTIARNLGMTNAEVARIVYPDKQAFGVWKDWQEPPLPGESEAKRDAQRRAGAEQRARLREPDASIRDRALGEDV